MIVTQFPLTLHFFLSNNVFRVSTYSIIIYYDLNFRMHWTPGRGVVHTWWECLWESEVPYIALQLFLTNVWYIIVCLTLSHLEALHWWVKLSGVRQSKITKCPLLVALGRKGLMLSLLEAFSWQVKLPRIRQSEIITGMVSAGLEEKGFRNGWWFDVLHSAMDAHRKLGEHRNV